MTDSKDNWTRDLPIDLAVDRAWLKSVDVVDDERAKALEEEQDMTDKRTAPIEAARRIHAVIKQMAGKRLPIQFPNDEVAMQFSTIIENAGNVARDYFVLAERVASERAKALEEAATWLRQEQASLILRMNRYADRFEKQPGKEAHAETVRNWVRELDDIAAAIRALRSKQT